MKMQLKVIHRLIVSTIALVIVAALFAFFFVSAKYDNITFATQEMKGDSYQRPLMELMNDVAEYQVQHSQVALGKTDADAKALSGQIEKDFADLGAQQAVVGADLKFNLEELKYRHRDNMIARFGKGQMGKGTRWSGRFCQWFSIG